MKKTLTVGHGYTEAPQNMTGAVAVTKESIDSDIKDLSWSNEDLKHFDGIKISKKKKRKKKIIKAILDIKNKFPQLLIKEIVEVFIDQLDGKVKKSDNNINKDLLKSIIKSVRKNYPNLDTENVVKIAEEVYKKKL